MTSISPSRRPRATERITRNVPRQTEEARWVRLDATPAKHEPAFRSEGCAVEIGEIRWMGTAGAGHPGDRRGERDGQGDGVCGQE